MASKTLKDPTFPSILDISDEELEKRYEWLEQQNERNLAIEEMAYEEDRWHDVHLDAPDGDEHDTYWEEYERREYYCCPRKQ